MGMRDPLHHAGGRAGRCEIHRTDSGRVAYGGLLINVYFALIVAFCLYTIKPTAGGIVCCHWPSPARDAGLLRSMAGVNLPLVNDRISAIVSVERKSIIDPFCLALSAAGLQVSCYRVLQWC